MGTLEAKQAVVIHLKFADGSNGNSPVMPRYIAEQFVGLLNVSQHWEGKRLIGTEIKVLSFSLGS
jgi:hypothetical protein